MIRICLFAFFALMMSVACPVNAEASQYNDSVVTPTFQDPDPQPRNWTFQFQAVGGSPTEFVVCIGGNEVARGTAVPGVPYTWSIPVTPDLVGTTVEFKAYDRNGNFLGKRSVILAI